MRGVVFKNLGQKFSSIIHTADLDSDSLSASCAASSCLPGSGRSGRRGKQNLELPPAGTRQGHGSTAHPGRAQYYTWDPLCGSESALPFTKDTLDEPETRLLQKLQLVCLSLEQLVHPLTKEKSFSEVQEVSYAPLLCLPQIWLCISTSV